MSPVVEVVEPIPVVVVVGALVVGDPDALVDVVMVGQTPVVEVGDTVGDVVGWLEAVVVGPALVAVGPTVAVIWPAADEVDGAVVPVGTADGAVRVVVVTIESGGGLVESAAGAPGAT